MDEAVLNRLSKFKLKEKRKEEKVLEENDNAERIVKEACWEKSGALKM